MSLLISKLLFVDISDRCEQQLMEYRYLTMNRVTVVEEIVFESIGHNMWAISKTELWGPGKSCYT